MELKASISLVTAGQMAAFDPATALMRLDRVRLEAPGTLFEEAAIRRSMPIAARLGDADKIRLLARNYLQRFSRSPYMQDFMAQFVDAAVKLSDRIGNAELAKLIGSADPAMQYSLYLQIARRARRWPDRAVALHVGRGEEAGRPAESRSEPRQSLRGGKRCRVGFGGQRAWRTGADRARKLPERDRKLLKAAETVGKLVTHAPETQPPQNPAPTPVAAEPEDDLDKTMEEARRKLAEIDALLGKTVK